MKQEQETRQLLRQLGSAPGLVDESERVEARRSKVVARLEALQRSELARHSGRAKWRRQLSLVAMVATPLLVIGGWWLLSNPTGPAEPVAAVPSGARVAAVVGSVGLSRAGQPEQLAPAEGVGLEMSDRVRTGPAGQARLSLASGAIVDLSPSTSVELAPLADAARGQHEQVDLESGKVALDVPKLAQGRSLAVHTPHARVVVHGTRFAVAVRAAESNRKAATFVSVQEGLVVVHAGGREVRLSAGSEWSSEPRPLAAAGPEDEQGDQGAEAVEGGDGPVAVGPAPSVGAQPPRAPGPSSTLAQQNRLYAKALAARDRGDDPAVVATLDELLTRYPDSALVPAARLERSRAVARMKRDSED